MSPGNYKDGDSVLVHLLSEFCFFSEQKVKQDLG